MHRFIPPLLLLLFISTPAALFANEPSIGTIQSDQATSPYIDQTVTIEGVVTGVRADRNSRGVVYHTLYVQDLPGAEDNDPSTSDGIAVFLGRNQSDYTIGDHLIITGRVVEFYGLTEISDKGLSIERIGRNHPLPASQLLLFNDANPERFEAMRVHTPDAPLRIVGPTYSGCGFTAVADAADTLTTIKQRATDPTSPLLAVEHSSDHDCSGIPSVANGDRIAPLAGVLTYEFDRWRLVADAGSVTFVSQQGGWSCKSADSCTHAAADGLTVTADELTISTYNINNLFDDIDHTGDRSEPLLSLDDIAHLIAKASAQLHQAGCPAIVALQEVETAALTQQLADQISLLCEEAFVAVHQESNDARGIDLAYLVRSDVIVLKDELRQGCTTLETGLSDSAVACSADEDALFSRAPYLLHLQQSDGTQLILINNHFKSKRGGEAETEPRRIAQANHVATLVAELSVTHSTVPIIVLGDFNDFELSPTQQRLRQAGLVSALDNIPLAQRYSYNFAGVSQLIDNIFITQAHIARVSDATIWHLNADYPATMRSAERIERATDHDLIVIALNAPTTTKIEAASAEPTPAATTPPPPSPWASSNQDWLLTVLIVALVAGGAGYLIGRRRT